MDLINPDLQTKALIRLKISVLKLYKAKVGVLEAMGLEGIGFVTLFLPWFFSR